MDKKLMKAIGIDILFLYPIVILGGFMGVGWAEVVAFILNVLCGIGAFVIAYNFEEVYDDMITAWKDYTSFYWVYVVSTTIVELAIFAYLGWYGMAVMWITMLAGMYYFFTKD